MAFRVSVREAAAKTISSTASPEAAAGGQGSRCGYDAGSAQEAAAGNLAIHCVYSLRFKKHFDLFIKRLQTPRELQLLHKATLFAGALAVQSGGNADAVFKAG